MLLASILLEQKFQSGIAYLLPEVGVCVCVCVYAYMHVNTYPQHFCELSFKPLLIPSSLRWIEETFLDSLFELS